MPVRVGVYGGGGRGANKGKAVRSSPNCFRVPGTHLHEFRGRQPSRE